MAYKILLVEDDAQLREIIVDYFSQKGREVYEIDTAGTGFEGEDKCLQNEYDLVLLDIMLPEVNGFTICKELRKSSDIPIIFITARNNEEDKLLGYNIGCDDYISKPFSLPELYAKVTALIRRSKGNIRSDLMKTGSIQLNPHRYTVLVDSKEVILPPKEYTILKILMQNAGRIVTRETLLIRIWGYDFEGNDRVVDNHIKKLRKSLGPAANQLRTIIKIGYKLVE
jgi:DNA-binding response OmpR family regulator